MKNLKSVLAVLTAICLMMCLAVPAFATTEPTTVVATEAATTAATTGETVAETTGETVAETTGETVAETTGETAAETTGEIVEDATTLTTGATEEAEGPSVIRVIVTVLEVIASLLLILVVLLQSGKESGLSGALSGSSDTYLSKTNGGWDKKLASATKWIGLAWIFLTMMLSLLP